MKKTKGHAKRSRSDSQIVNILRLNNTERQHKSLTHNLHNICKKQLFLTLESQIDEMKISASELNIHFCVDEPDQIRDSDIPLAA